ncbi:GroES-like protein [Myriangium duriaei CBS 260.36]|uniref:GroES-like protein n=1 Tax=Myriangium duriaei CBS 260.36 TaxID=1168546 RepID=A0A9P4MG66_9PEZI|nr:GroES-like protein [Myriangium duriaei CBS 260.36]
MKEAIVSKGPTVTIKDVPIPKAGQGQVVIKVVVSGSNPKDWKLPEWTGAEANEGDDIAGTIHEVGPGASAYGFKVGDRVAAFHEMRTPHGSYAEYAVAHAYTTFFLPDETSFEEGAALPLAFLTAAVGLYAHDRLALPEPWAPATKTTPLVVYGGASAVGAYVIKYAQRSNIHPIITVAGRGKDFVEKLIDRSKGDTIVDYRSGDEAVVKGLKEALKGEKLYHAFDAVSEKGSYVNISKVLESDGKITLVLPGKEEIPKTIQKSQTMVGDVHSKLKDLGLVHSRYITKGLLEGWFPAHPHEVVPGGLEGIQQALTDLKEGKASAVKYVFRIGDTKGL